MKCLVTGATGFTGGRLVSALLKQGHQVRALVRAGSSVDRLERLGVEVIRGELTDSALVDEVAKGCDQIYHIAAVYRTAGHPDEYYYSINVTGTENILHAARLNNCERVIHCSTCGVHGHVEHPPANEDYRIAPDDVYQRSKVVGEKKVQEAISLGQRAVIFRPCAIYGEGDTRFLKLFKAIAKRRFVMIGTGQTRLHMVHVDDLVDGILLCGSRPEAIGQTFLLGGGQAPTLNELAQCIAQVFQVPAPSFHIPVAPIYALGWLCEKLCVPFNINPPLHRRRVGFFTHHREFDCSRARTLLGYEPKISTLEGVRRTADWYKQEGLLK